MLFIFLDNSCSSSLLESLRDCLIDVKSPIFFDMSLISSLALDIKSEKLSIESFRFFEELSSTIIISSLFDMGIPFCFASYNKKWLY